MTDLGVAIGLVLVIEGLLWALAPGFGRRLLRASADMLRAVACASGALSPSRRLLVDLARRTTAEVVNADASGGRAFVLATISD